MVKVAVLGAGGGVGQALCLQLRLSPFVDELALYDRTRAAGVAVDLSHIPVNQVINGYKAVDHGLTKALADADIVVLTAGPSVTPGVTITSRNDLLNVNGSIVGSLVDRCGKVCPKALILIVTNPVNAMVPFATEVLKRQNTFDARRLFGVTTLDVVRAETFLAEMLGTVSELGTGLEVNVIGGHSAETVVPLFSQVEMPKELSSEQVNELIYHTQRGGYDVYLAKEKKSAATLSTAYAAFRMTERISRALKGEKEMRECCFVYLPGIEGGNEIVKAVGVDFFATKVEFSEEGAVRVSYPLKGISEKEEGMVKEGVKQLIEDIKLGSEWGETFGTDVQNPNGE